MTVITTSSRAEYLERLRDLLPPRDADRIVRDVEGLLLDRMDAEQAEGGATPEEAERRAVTALGSPEVLAEQLVSDPVHVDLATRRSFLRLLAVVFAVHLFLDIVLTVAGGKEAVFPGLLGPFPTRPVGALFSAVLSVFLADVGALFCLFALLGPHRAPALLPDLDLRTRATRRSAVATLILLALVALILHPFRDTIFAVRTPDRLVGFLTSDVLQVLPVFDAGLVLLALRQVLLLSRGGERMPEVVLDALASLVLAAGLVLVAAGGDLVSFPDEALGHGAAETLSDLVTRAFLLVFVVAALFLTVRFVKRAIRVRRLALAR